MPKGPSITALQRPPIGRLFGQICRLHTSPAGALLFGMLLMAHAIPARGDTIKVGDRAYENVFVRESPSRFYVQFPEDGSVHSYPKSEVPPENVSIDPDQQARKALLAAWDQARLDRAQEEAEAFRASSAVRARHSAEPKALVLRRDEEPVEKRPAPRMRSQSLQPREGQYTTDGMVQPIRLKDVPLREALKGVLRPLNLDYRVEGNMLWISTPQRLRTESFASPRTRGYPMVGPAGDTLFKVVLSNPGGPSGSVGTRGSGGTIGSGGSGGNWSLSEMFGTFPDEAVGETPAWIGMLQTPTWYVGNGPYNQTAPTTR